MTPTTSTSYDTPARADLKQADLKPEDRNQIIARRRAAQLEWRSAHTRAEHASRKLAEAVTRPLTQAVSAARSRLDLAQSREREARSSYYRVAEETGALLSRLHRIAAGRR